MKTWKILNDLRFDPSADGGELALSAGRQRIEELIELLLKNREITTKKDKEDFLFPRLEDVTPENVGIDDKQLKIALTRIKKAIKEQEQIIVFGDYDVDGITATAIVWETLYALGAKATPYIPNRIDEGYGLSKIGISNLLQKYPENCHSELVSESHQKKMLKRVQHDKDCLGIKLIITVDNGIVANDAVDFANQQKIDVIITDHHTIGEKIPNAHAIVHTIKLCGAGIAYLLSEEINLSFRAKRSGVEKSHTTDISSNSIGGDPSTSVGMTKEDDHLELATLGTVADMVPLTGANRAIVKHGLEKLAKTKRPGLRELFEQAGLRKDIFKAYEIGYVIGPRLNAAGRIDTAMDSLRLLCTKDRKKALMLAEKLELTNRERQLLLKQAAEHAIAKVRGERGKGRSLLFIAHEEYQEGIIGLVAGKLVEEFYRPSIVISKGKKMSKASARSITGFNIIEFLRTHKEHFVNVGGHPMAAGFTIETEKIVLLQEALETTATNLLTDDMLQRTLKIDCELPLSVINVELYQRIQDLAPFGMGNPEPVFVSRGIKVADIRVIGKEGNHLKLRLQQENSQLFEAVAFGMGAMAVEIHKGDSIDVVYTIDENTWNGMTSLQLKVKDIRSLIAANG